MSSLAPVSSNFFNCTSIAASMAVPASRYLHNPLLYLCPIIPPAPFPLSSFSICPIVPPAPSSPLPETPPLIFPEPSLLSRIANLFGVRLDEPLRLMSMQEALEQNRPPILAYWLQKNDKELAEHINSQNDLSFVMAGKGRDLIAKPAENGNILLVLTYLDRIANCDPILVKPEVVVTWVLEEVFKNALKGGQLDLILAVLRKGYPIAPNTKALLLKEAALRKPEIALVLAGENMPEEALLAGMEGAIKKDRLELIRPFLNVRGQRYPAPEGRYLCRQNEQGEIIAIPRSAWSCLRNRQRRLSILPVTADLLKHPMHWQLSAPSI